MRRFLASISKLFPVENKRSAQRRSFRLMVEQLEDRSVPSVSPVLLTPSGATTPNPTFNWGSVSGATSYDFWLTDQTLGTTVITQSNLTTTSFTPTSVEPLNQSDTFQWTARADNGNGPMGPYSTPFTFTADASLLNPNWLTEAGSYTYSNNQTTAVGHSGENTGVLAGVNIANVSAQASVTFTAGGQNAGLVLRYAGSGDTNMYLGRLVYSSNGAVNAAIDRNINGAWAQIGTSANIAGNGGTLVFQAQGADLKLFLNGTLVAYALDSTFAGGTVGIRSSAGVTLSGFAGNPANLTSATLPFSDDFSAASFGNQLSSSWLERAGNFNVATGVARSQGTIAALATVNGIDTADANVQGDVFFSAPGQYAGLVARYSGPGASNFYFGRLEYLGNGVANAAIYRNVNGVWSQVGSGENVSANQGTLDFQVQGSNLSLYLNGNIVANGQDSTFSTGAVGMLAAASQIANFQASNAVSSNSNWVDQAGVINLATGTAITQPGAGGTATMVGSTGTDVSVQGTVGFSSVNQYAGLVARYSGPGDRNMYYGRLVDLGNGMVNAAIYRNLNGAWTQIGASTNVAATGGQLIFQVEGSDLKLFLNGSLVAYGQDTVLKSGLSGIRAFGGATVASFQSNAATLTTNTAPFGDTFTAPTQGNQLSYSWEEQAGNFNLATGAAVAQSSSTANLATVNGILSSNANVQANFTLSAVGQYAGLVARYSGLADSNMYYAYVMSLSGGKFAVAITRNLGGTWTQLASTTITSFNGAMQFQVTGNNLSVSVGGVHVLSVTDSTISGPGLVGMRSGKGASYTSFAAS